MALTASSKSICNLRFFKPKQHKTHARVTKGDSGRPSRLSAVADEEAVSLSVVEATEPDGVMFGGVKLQDTPEGKPAAQLNETAELNPFSGVAEMVVVTLFPEVTAKVDGEAAIE
jgi:hypothetical protein